MPAVLKLKCKDQVHRVQLQNEKPTYEEIMAAIQQLHPEGPITAKYLDEENDMCTFCASSFSDFLMQSTERNGHKVWRLELILPERPESESQRNTHPSGHVDNSHEAHSGGNPVANIMQFGFDMFRRFAGKGLSKGMPGVCGGHVGGPAFWKLKFALLQMQRSNVLSANSVAALITKALPDLISHIASHVEMVDSRLDENFSEDVRPLFEDLCTSVSGTLGLEHCAGKIGDVIERKVSPSEALLETLSALDMIPFETQVAFIEAVYTCQEGRLQKLLKDIETNKPWIPTIPLTHSGVTCDGCNQGPIQGLRFKCKSCPDFDLCAGCFTRKGALHGSQCSAHEFDLLVFPSCSPPWATWFMGHGKGKGKGKRSCKGTTLGKRGSAEACAEGDEQPTRACARKGCKYAASCEQKTFHNEKASMQDEPQCAHMPVYDFAFPVVVEDGRNLTIQWYKTEDPHQVAQNFALQHGIPEEEVPTIQAFVVRASSMCGATVGNASQVVDQAATVAEDEEMKAVREQFEKVSFGSSHMEAHIEEPQPSEQHGEHEHMAEVNDEELMLQSQRNRENEKPQHQPKNAESCEDEQMANTAKQFEEMGLGSADVILQLLMCNNGDAQSVLEMLLKEVQ